MSQWVVNNISLPVIPVNSTRIVFTRKDRVSLQYLRSYFISSFIEDSTINVALNKATNQSSTPKSHGMAENAVDGNRESDFGQGSCTTTVPYTHSPWWRVDLGNVVGDTTSTRFRNFHSIHHFSVTSCTPGISPLLSSTVF